MKSARVVARTDRGKTALEKHIAESLRLPKRKKLMFKMLGYTQEITKQEPLTIEIELKNKTYQELLKKSHFRQQLEETLKDNGATAGVDYYLDVV